MVEWRGYIEQRPDVMVGKPVIRGTRITVEHILERLGQGSTEDDLLQAHPQLRPEHLRAALLYAADSLSLEKTFFLPDAAK